MKVEYGFPNIPELANVSVIVERRGEKTLTSILGPCSTLHRFIIKRYFAFHNKLGAIYQTDTGNVYSMYIPEFPSLAHNRMLEAFLISKVFKRPAPFAATIGVSAKCQFHCVHCSAAGRPANIPEMSTAEIKRVVGECIDMGITNITFTGGEPLLREDLETCIRAVPTEKAVCLIFTNGQLMTAERAKSLKAAGLFGVHISIDSPDPEINDGLRGARGALKGVRDAVENARNAGLLVGLSTYVTKQAVYLHSIREIAELCSQWGVNELTVFDAIQTGRLNGLKTHQLNRLSRFVLLRDNWVLNRKYKNKPRVVTQTWTNTAWGFARYIGCLAANLQFHITAQGDFAPCDFTPLSFGNIRETPVKELWDKLLVHPGYKSFSQKCRMQDKSFRGKYIETIPEDADLPYNIRLLD